MLAPRVAHLLPAYNPFPPVYPAGTELRVEQVALRERRYRPLVVCAHFGAQPERETIGAMTVQRIRIGRIYRRLFQKITRLDPWSYWDRMARVIDAEQPVLLHVHNEPKVVEGLLAHLRRAPRPVIVHVANEKLPEPGVRAIVTHWVAVSRYMARWLEQRCEVPRERISVVYTGVDVAGRPPLWATGAVQRQALRERFGVSDPGARIIVFAGRLVKEKGVHELLSAFEQLRAVARAPLALLVAGNVRESDDPRNEKAVYGRSVVARMKEIPGVRYVGSLHPAAMHEFLLAGDVFAMPSLWDDPFPTVMIEAAAAGLPIVAAARGGVTEFLEGCEAFAFLDRPEDPAALARALQRYIDSPADCERAGRWLRGRVEAHHDWQRVADDFESLYDTLLAREAS